MISVSLTAENATSERAMGGEGCRWLAFCRGFASRGPFDLRFVFPWVRDGALSTSLRSLLSASASSSTSLSIEASLWESSARVATDWLSSSSSVRRRRAMLVVLLRAGAMIAGVWIAAEVEGAMESAWGGPRSARERRSDESAAEGVRKKRPAA
jgi:hypothetical protein